MWRRKNRKTKSTLAVEASHTVRPPRMEKLESRELMSVTTTTIFHDDFDHGNQGWTNDTYLSTDSRNAWSIGKGMPGFGTHSGANCANTTGPGTDCDLASPAIDLPAVDQYSDHEYVKFYSNTKYTAGVPFAEVRQWVPELSDWGPWNVIEPNADPLAQNSNGWRSYGYDATLFAGSTVQFGYHQYGTGKWAIDDVSVTEEHIPHAWVGNENFTNGLDGWYGGDGMWDTAYGYAGTAVHGSSPAGDSALWSPAFYMPNAGSVTLNFQSWTSQTSGALMNVIYSYWWPGTGWSPYYVAGEPLMPGKAGAWESMSVNLSDTIGSAQITPIRIGFYFDNPGVSASANWFVTNISLTASGSPSSGIPGSNGSGGLFGSKPISADETVDQCKALFESQLDEKGAQGILKAVKHHKTKPPVLPKHAGKHQT